MIDFRIFQLQQNSGHGIARRKGLKECRNRFVALMDSDDISLSNRFECQLREFYRHPELSIVGGQIAEFIGTSDNITGIRQVPQTDRKIKEYMKIRCPMNQVSVMFKKDEVQRSGGYLDWYCEEDYYLWARMALSGCIFSNVPETLVNVRVGNEMSARRGGMKYFLSETRMQLFLYKKNIISFLRFFYNITIRFLGEVLIPSKLRVKIFRLFRKKATIDERKSSLEYKEQSKEMQNYPPFSVAMCVYGGDNAQWFDEALESVVNQTVKPQEIVLIVDGPIPDSIQKVIEKYKKVCSGMSELSFQSDKN